MATGAGSAAANTAAAAAKAKGWLDLAYKVAIVLFFLMVALGFRFRTPASWLAETNASIDTLRNRVVFVEAESREAARLLRVTVRVICTGLSVERAVMLPECDEYRSAAPPRMSGPPRR